jgi:hypothetical protein
MPKALRRLVIRGFGSSKNRTSRAIRIHQGGGTKGPGRSDRNLSPRSYRPGDAVKQSGIYEVVHDREHRSAHEVVMISGDAFPNCETCDQNVRFRLVRTAPYIFQDQDFEEEES